MAPKLSEQDYPLGLATITMEFDDYSGLRYFEDQGVGLLELQPIVPDNKAWTAADPKSSENLMKLCRQHKVQPDSVHSFFFENLGHDMASPDVDIRKSAIKLNTTLFPAAKAVGARYIIVHLCSEGTQRSADEIYSLAKEAVLELIPHAEKTGVCIAIENLDENWSIREINSLLEDLNHPLLGICFDTGHSALYNPVGDELALCGDRLIGLHIHDNWLQKDNHLIPFRGKIDWPDFARGLLKTGYQGPLLLESLEREPDETSEQFIIACTEAYRKLLAVIGDAATNKA